METCHQNSTKPVANDGEYPKFFGEKRAVELSPLIKEKFYLKEWTHVSQNFSENLTDRIPCNRDFHGLLYQSRY